MRNEEWEMGIESNSQLLSRWGAQLDYLGFMVMVYVAQEYKRILRWYNMMLFEKHRKCSSILYLTMCLKDLPSKVHVSF